jgi:2-polyprenyl-6-methoxyphenol hydroxylase-like FAD-dependent oxidoreductase
MTSAPILVAGAGPTGLVLALSLARHGAEVRIIDQLDGPGQTSRAMVLHARNLEFYDQFGFASEVVAAGIKVERMHLREDGEEVATFAFGDIGAGLSPYPFLLCYPQDDHERFLVGKLGEAGVRVEWGTKLVSFTQDDTGVTATLERAGKQETVRTPYLCGCDGSRSTVRHGIGAGFPGGDYEQLFYVADVEAGDDSTDAFLNLDAHGFGLKFPVRSTGMHRLIGLVPSDLASREGLTFEDIRERVEPLIGVRVQRVNWFSTYRSHHRVAGQFRAGRCFLAGDAGHIHSPVGGQGMNTGIGDAINLAWKLAAVVRGRLDPAMLDTYEAERIPFARQLVQTTDRMFQGVAGRGVGSAVLRTWLMPHLFPFLTGFSAVRRVMFRAVSQTRIAYHDSALSAGAAGDVRGGDRLPWVEPSNNFAPLRSNDWQVHVYGQADPAFRAAAEERGLPLHRFEWTDAAGTAGLERDAAYVVRPDGHVGLAGKRQDPAELGAYIGRIGLQMPALAG